MQILSDILGGSSWTHIKCLQNFLNTYFNSFFSPTKYNSSHIWGRWYFKDVVVNKATMINLQWQSIWARYSLEDLFPGKWGLVFPSLPPLLNCSWILEINSHMCLMKASWTSTKEPKSKTVTVSVRKHCCLNLFHHKVLEQCAWHIVGAQEKLSKEWMNFQTFWNISGSNWVMQRVFLSLFYFCGIMWNVLCKQFLWRCFSYGSELGTGLSWPAG